MSMNCLSLTVLGKRHTAMPSDDTTSFPCTKCGACCRSLHQNDVYVALDLGNGVCKNLNEANECSIYEQRPLMCNIDVAYEEYYKPMMTKIDYYVQNAQACNTLQQLLGIPEDFRVHIHLKK